MKTRSSFSLIALTVLILTLASCSNTKHFAKNQYLITQSRVQFTDKNPGIDVSELNGLVEQNPNKRFLGVFRFKLWAYNRSLKGKESKFNNWLENTVGERPVILDTSMAQSSCREMETYLGNVGYFNSDINYSAKYNEKSKEVQISYIVSPSVPYHLKSVRYEIDDPELNRWIMLDTSRSLIKTGSIYNVYTLDKERERITYFLNNNGYYGFVKDYVFFEVDSTFGSREMELFVKVKNVSVPDPDSAGKFIEKRHYRYKVDKVVIYPDYEPSRQMFQEQGLDTLRTEIHQIRKDQPANYYYVVYRNKLRINPKILAQMVLIEDNEPYKIKDVQQTYKRLKYLSIFRYANISFYETVPMAASDSNFKSLECRINLQRAPLHQYSIEAEGTNSGGDLGMGGNITYRNRNIFRNGETFQLKFRGAMEAQRTSNTENENQQEFLFFNTFEWGVEAMISFPRFLIPVKLERFPKYFRPTTRISTGINFRKRSTYDRYILNFTFGYRWQESDYKTHILQPFNISSVKVFPTPEFSKELEAINDPRLKNQYTDHLITALQYSFIFNNQDIKKAKDFIYFRGNIETSGNIFHLFNNLLDSKQDSTGVYHVAGIRYAQYAKMDFDFRYYLMASHTNQVVFRAIAGIGIPYGNSDALPFEKGFYLGGANSMRAWIYRGLGPGGFVDPGTNIDKMGEILLECNIEYRFPIYSFFKGALFYDVGNIWLLNRDDNFTDAEFKFDTFYKQIAMDAGFGFRFDFKFFIFRVDFALRLRDPAQPEGSRWVGDKAIWFWNFGIGYPF